jgi:hypothetical protein
MITSSISGAAVSASSEALTIAASALLANDTDANGDTLTITGVSGGVNGTASYNAQANNVTFTPAAGYIGAASFNYAILATATFSSETASGWQQVNFATPVAITAGTTYVASYHTNGNYSADPNYFATAHTNGPLTAPSSPASGGNGVYAYGSGGLFPTNTYNSTSYGVDVLFRAQLAA